MTTEEEGYWDEMADLVAEEVENKLWHKNEHLPMAEMQQFMLFAWEDPR